MFRPKLRSCCSKLWKGASKNNLWKGSTSKNEFPSSSEKCCPPAFILYSLAPRRLQNIQIFSLTIAVDPKYLVSPIFYSTSASSSSSSSPTQPPPLPLQGLAQGLPPPHLGQVSLSSRSFPTHEPSPSKPSSSPSGPCPRRA